MCLVRPHTGIQAGKLPGGPSRKDPALVFTFEPIPERECKLRVQKKRAPRVLYPPHQVRKPVPPKKDAPKRLLLLFLSIVLLQVYTATEDETPDLKVAEQLGFAAAPHLSSADDRALPPAFPGAEGNCSRQQPAGGFSCHVVVCPNPLRPSPSRLAWGGYPMTLIAVYTSTGHSRK